MNCHLWNWLNTFFDCCHHQAWCSIVSGSDLLRAKPKISAIWVVICCKDTVVHRILCFNLEKMIKIPKFYHIKLHYCCTYVKKLPSSSFFTQCTNNAERDVMSFRHHDLMGLSYGLYLDFLLSLYFPYNSGDLAALWVCTGQKGLSLWRD